MFQKYLGDFHKKYGFIGAFNGFYYHYPSPEARWAFLARMGYMEYECPTGQPYYDLMELLKGKNYHIMTTNQDFQFTRVVSEEKLSAIGEIPAIISAAAGVMTRFITIRIWSML